MPTLKELKAVIEWIRTTVSDTDLKEVLEMRLPAKFKKLSVDGKVTAVLVSDGRYCILLKSSIGWKNNFQGILYIQNDLKRDEILEADGRTYISVSGIPPFEELYLNEKKGEGIYLVYFDLY